MFGLAPEIATSMLALLLFCVLAETGQQLCFKAGVDRIPESAGPVLGALRQPLIWIGVVLWVVEVIAWIIVLQTMPLSLAYPVMTLVYVGVPIGGALLLGERMTRRRIGGSVLVAAGVLCVALSGAGA